MKKHIPILLLLFVIFSLHFVTAGRINPAAKYCEDLGYEYKYDYSSGIENCILANKTEVSAWLFLLGDVAQEYSYCKRQNLSLEVVTDSSICEELGLETCAVCVFEDGTKLEVTKVMGMNLITGYCGDKTCQIGETYQNCQEDCKSGANDGFCDSIRDKICDEDCILQQTPSKDVDCPYCGDSKCIGQENYKNCQSDCPSGFRDEYCDEIIDGRCDFDCDAEKDKDCKLSFWEKLILWIKKYIFLI